MGRKEVQSSWRDRNRSSLRSKAAIYRKDNANLLSCKRKSRGREDRLKGCYGMTFEDYNRMLKDQDGKCLICGNVAPLVVDHNHKTQVVRALLCAGCNTGLGFLQESIDILLSAISYLKRFGDGKN